MPRALKPRQLHSVRLCRAGRPVIVGMLIPRRKPCVHDIRLEVQVLNVGSPNVRLKVPNPFRLFYSGPEAPYSRNCTPRGLSLTSCHMRLLLWSSYSESNSWSLALTTFIPPWDLPWTLDP